MPQVEKIKVLNVDGVTKAVDDMSDSVKQLVEVYDDWNQKEADLRSDLMQLQFAKSELSRQIMAKIREDEAEANSDEGDAEAPADSNNESDTASE